LGDTGRRATPARRPTDEYIPTGRILMSDVTPADAAARVRRIDRSPRRVLIVANQTATSPSLVTELRRRARLQATTFHLVVPALNSRLRHWLSDTDDAVRQAQRRAEHARSALRSHGVRVTAEAGDSVPLLAIEDALAQFDADEIVISTLPPDRSHWLEHELVDHARERFALPVSHVIGEPRAAAAA
jgi:GABA permease